MRLKGSIISLAALSAGMLAAQPAYAQGDTPQADAAAQDNNQNADIVVTAQFPRDAAAGYADRDHRGQCPDARSPRPDRHLRRSPPSRRT
ncbi:MAG: hypothetical protein WDN24_16170 [Sphingomonas sp.]